MSDSVDSLPEFGDDTEVSVRYALPDAVAMIARAKRHVSIEVASMVAVEICERMLEGAQLHADRLWIDIVGHLHVYELKGRKAASVEEMIRLLLPAVHVAARPQFERVLRGATGEGLDRVEGLRSSFAAVLYPIDRVAARASLSRSYELALRSRDISSDSMMPQSSSGSISGEGPQSLDILLSGLDDSVFETQATSIREHALITSGPTSEDEAPDTFGRFEIFGEIARGGMAQVLLARDPSDGLVCVVKRMLPWHENQSSYQQMFKDEARLGLRLSHPNICRTLGYFEESSERCIQMEWARGFTLSKLISLVGDGATVSVSLVLEIGIAICSALKYAHEEHGADGRPLKVIHRDVSPQNIVLQYDGVIKLLDFGVARSLLQTEMTMAGQVKGKYAYMSPEQALGHPLDDRADVFCVGICLYEALAGEPLFDRGDRLSTIRAMADGVVPDITVKRPDVAPEVAAILSQALAADVEERPHMPELYEKLCSLAQDLSRPTALGIAEEVRELDPSWADWRGKLVPYVDLGMMPQPIVSDDTFEEEESLTTPYTDLRSDPTHAQSPKAMRAASEEPSEPSETSEPERDSKALWGLAVLALLLIAVGVWFAFRPHDSPRIEPPSSPTANPPEVGVIDVEPAPVPEQPALEAPPETEAESAEVDEPSEELAPLGRIFISTRPGGATVSVIDDNDEPRPLEGATPKLFELPLGLHRLRIEREGYRPTTRRARIRGQRAARLWVRLRRR